MPEDKFKPFILVAVLILFIIPASVGRSTGLVAPIDSNYILIGAAVTITMANYMSD